MKRSKSYGEELIEGARLLKAAGHPARLALLELLIESARTVGDIQAMLDLSQPNLSQHLALLKRVGLIQSHASGAMRCYYLLQPSLVKSLLTLVRKDFESAPKDKESVVAEALKNRPQEAPEPPKKARRNGGKAKRS